MLVVRIEGIAASYEPHLYSTVHLPQHRVVGMVRDPRVYPKSSYEVSCQHLDCGLFAEGCEERVW